MRKLDRPPYKTSDELERFDQSQDAFSTNPPDHACACAPPDNAAPARSESQDRAEQVVSAAAWQIHDHLGRHFFGAMPEAIAGRDEERTDATANSALVRQAAGRLGADLVGVCRLNPDWLFSRDRAGDEVTLPDGCVWAVVMAVAMDADDIRKSPALAAGAATGVGYMKMAVCAAGLGAFIRGLGYNAVAAGNNTALSIPLAVDAGLGEMGRNGLLITPEFGPCVRLCKVITDLPLEPGRPVEFGARNTCTNCGRCVEACPAGAIDARPEPTFDTACQCNNPGVLRWPVDAAKCHAFWHRNGGSCSSCIAACPFTPR